MCIRDRFSTSHAARIDLPVNRVSLFVDQAFMTVRERPSIEIDTRVRRREDVLIGGLDLRAGSKTILRVDATRQLQKFEEEAAFESVNLAAALNRRSEVAGLSLRHRATALTTFVVLGEALRERFVASSTRDSDSVRVTPGVELDPRALIGGRAFVGYRRFIIRSGVAPKFTGLVASVELASTIRNTTRLSVRANRDVAYSYDVTSPYYLLTTAGVSVVRRLGQNWDLGVAVGRDNLNYERWTIPPATIADAVGLPPRFETVNVVGGSTGYRLGDNMRLAVSYDFTRRTSTRLRRPYEGAKIISQFIYGS